jgi:hypothetical protein
MRTFASLLLAMAAGLFCAPFQKPGVKPAPRPEIRGVVIEPGTSQPVVDAEITLEYYGPQKPRIMPSPPKSSMTTKSDASGAFVFRPVDVGYFYIRAKKDGYAEMAGMPPASSSAQSVTLSAAQPVKEVRPSLSLPGQITGLVVDEETRKPIAKLRLQALSVRQHGRLSPPRGTAASSQADGEFVVPTWPQGTT